MFSSWSATNGDWVINWQPFAPYIWGNPVQVAEVQRYIFESDLIAVTPTGPSIPSKWDSAEAVFLAVSQLYPDAQFTNAPDLSKYVEQYPDGEDVVF